MKTLKFKSFGRDVEVAFTTGKYGNDNTPYIGAIELENGIETDFYGDVTICLCDFVSHLNYNDGMESCIDAMRDDGLIDYYPHETGYPVLHINYKTFNEYVYG